MKSFRYEIKILIVWRENQTNYIIQNWMRTRNAIEFNGLWEQLNNPEFNEAGSKTSFIERVRYSTNDIVIGKPFYEKASALIGNNEYPGAN